MFTCWKVIAQLKTRLSSGDEAISTLHTSMSQNDPMMCQSF